MCDAELGDCGNGVRLGEREREREIPLAVSRLLPSIAGYHWNLQKASRYLYGNVFIASSVRKAAEAIGDA